VSFDWRKEFKRQHGYAPGENVPTAITESPTPTADTPPLIPAHAETQLFQPARPERDAGPGLGPRVRGDERGSGGEGENPVEPGASASPDFERVEIAPNQFVNLATARRLGLVAS
jgi:hypothetical protein